jgi:UDP-N-acetylmuramoylalanine-D-glutamate ligase
MAKFILDEGGILGVTDLRQKEMLLSEIAFLNKYLKSKKNIQSEIVFTLGEHTQNIFDEADIVVFNPAVPFFSKWVQYCIEKNKEIYNDFTLFQKYLQFKNNKSNVPSIDVLEFESVFSIVIM